MNSLTKELMEVIFRILKYLKMIIGERLFFQEK